MNAQQALRSLIVTAIASSPSKSATVHEINAVVGWRAITRYRAEHSVPTITSIEVLNLVLGQMLIERQLNIATRDGGNRYVLVERVIVPPDHTAEIEDLKERVKALEDLVRNFTQPV
jgi:hypothetical protein